ncbi:MAG TPA: potassium transporter TrkG [Candidatus Limnocylindrales bacterium]|nr:potassium transporter TrkG [Candidatus Limnocylindrales bacterium]
MRQGRRPGDRRVRVGRRRPQAIAADAASAVRRPPRRPALVLAAGFLALIAIGTGLLTLPLSAAAGTWTSPVDALFTATSAVCVTGLVVVDTGTYWSPFGQLVILGLIQVGGFGFMTGSTLLLLLLVGRRTGLSERILAQESAGARDLGSVRIVLRRVAIFSLVAEGIGAAVLTLAFLARYGDATKAAWHGIFHAVSAFNNAGFDLMGGFASLNGFAGTPSVFVPIGVLIFLGGLGVAIVGDVIDKRRWVRFALETKLVLATTAVLLAAGTAALLAFEWGNPATLGALPEVQRPLNALFESVSFRTAGMSTVPIGSLTESSLITAIALMFIGGASGSTAGGIKVTTFAILLFTIISTVRGREFTEAFGRRVTGEVVARALSIALLAVAFGFGGTLLVEVLGAPGSFLQIAFETASAFGTVGHTTGITPQLSDPVLVVLAVAMFIGRLGPLTLVLALSARSRPVRYRPAVETLRIG